MARDLSLLIRRMKPVPQTSRPPIIAEIREESGIIDRSVAARLGRAPVKPTPWIREEDLRDALMTFALVFTGAVVFLL
jgi:hypothetical protein